MEDLRRSSSELLKTIDAEAQQATQLILQLRDKINSFQNEADAQELDTVSHL